MAPIFRLLSKRRNNRQTQLVMGLILLFLVMGVLAFMSAVFVRSLIQPVSSEVSLTEKTQQGCIIIPLKASQMLEALSRCDSLPAIPGHE